MTELVAEFRQGTRRHLATLRRAAASGDADAMVFAAHTLRGNSGTIGARRVFALASKVEELAAAACTEEASTLIAPLETEYERIQGALDAAVAAGEAATSAS